MFSFLQNNSYRKSIGFEDIKIAINSNNYVLINTLNIDEQNVLIKTTLNAQEEENIINRILYVFSEPDKPIIVYGKNSTDASAMKKYDQLQNLGLKDIYIYCGGLFEWLLLNELYGDEEFPVYHTASIDLLKYRPKSTFNQNLL